MYLQQQTGLYSREGIEPVPVEHPIVSERAPSRRCTRYGEEASGFLPTPIAMTHPTKQVPPSCDPRLLPKVSLHSGPSIVSSCETPRHSTKNDMAPFSRAPLNLTIARFIAVLSWVWRSCRSFFPRCAWRARESFDWTRGTTPTHTPPTPRLVWLSSVSRSGWVANGSSHCSRCPTPPPPRPSYPPRPFPPPPSSVCVCVCVFIKLHITAQSGLVILVILCPSHCVCVCVCVCIY